jgi:hypothetical protein
MAQTDQSGHPAPYPIDEADAMMGCILATEIFLSLPFDVMPLQQRAGAVLFYETFMRRIKPKLPRTPALQHVFASIAQAEGVAAHIRRVAGLPPVE